MRVDASLPPATHCGRRRAGRAADLQVANVAAVRLSVANLHPAGFDGGLLPYTSVLERDLTGVEEVGNLKTLSENGFHVTQLCFFPLNKMSVHPHENQQLPQQC